MDAVDTLIFDVMGTVVDDESTTRAQTTALLTDAGLPAGQITVLLDDWEQRISARMEAVRQGRSGWLGHEELRRSCLEETGASLAPELVHELSAVIHHLKPWPDSVEGLTDLRRSFTVVALSNADPAELIGLSAAGGLAWHRMLSAGLVRSFKPDPAVYRMALEQLAVDASRVMMVAAHPWDLRAAAREGFSTAYIARPNAERPESEDHFTVVADDLRQLARILT